MNHLDNAIARMKYAIEIAERDALHPEHFSKNGNRLPMRPNGTVIVPTKRDLMGRSSDCAQAEPLDPGDRASAHLSVLVALTEMRSAIMKRILADRDAITAAKAKYLDTYVSDDTSEPTERQAIRIIRDVDSCNT